jgi:2-polyprenyl-3-methyl-5-hydroxy-6-metoxy-1,4-benzoquinol methylase
MTSMTVAHDDLRAAALRVLEHQRVGLLIVAYDAERHIANVLERVPGPIAEHLAAIHVIDDYSSDLTYAAALEAGARLGLRNLTVYRTPMNRGYGGNQKIGYRHAENTGVEIVVLLHGDGQYAPESMWEMLAPFDDDRVDAVLGSRMLRKRDAARGGMPVYKWLGNQMLSWFENRMLRTHLSEFHTGYRAYRMSKLRHIPYKFNSDDFHFDTEILIQFMSSGATIKEVPIPTHYGDEVCHVNGIRYAWDCAKAVTKYRIFRMGLFYDPFLDCESDEDNYVFKEARNTLHQFVLTRMVTGSDDILDLGAGSGALSAEMAKVARSVVAVDLGVPMRAGGAQALALDLNADFDRQLRQARFNKVLALDVIEHVASPEEMIDRVVAILPAGGSLLASTANVGYFVPRLMLGLGQFNYGKRGILDLTHTRLFTVSSFCRLLSTRGFDLEVVRGFGPPIRDLISSRWPFSTIDSVLAGLARAWPRLFAYNFLVVGRRRPTVDELVAATVESASTDGVSELHPAKSEETRPVLVR